MAVPILAYESAKKVKEAPHFTSKPVIGFDVQAHYPATKRRPEVTTKGSVQITEFALVGAFAIYALLRIYGIDLFPKKDGGGGSGTSGPAYLESTLAMTATPFGTGVYAPGAGASVAIGQTKTPPPGVIPTTQYQGYRPPGGRGQA